MMNSANRVVDSDVVPYELVDLSSGPLRQLLPTRYPVRWPVVILSPSEEKGWLPISLRSTCTLGIGSALLNSILRTG